MQSPREACYITVDSINGRGKAQPTHYRIQDQVQKCIRYGPQEERNQKPSRNQTAAEIMRSYEANLINPEGGSLESVCLVGKKGFGLLALDSLQGKLHPGSTPPHSFIFKRSTNADEVFGKQVKLSIIL